MPELIERELRTAQVTVRQISENASQRGKLLLNNRAETKATPERAGNAIEGLTIGPSPALTQEVPNG